MTNLTPKQVARVQNKISDIRKLLASEKRRIGVYDDSRGIAEWF
jgi:hypothetical protein